MLLIQLGCNINVTFEALNKLVMQNVREICVLCLGRQPLADGSVIKYIGVGTPLFCEAAVVYRRSRSAEIPGRLQRPTQSYFGSS